MPDKHYLNIEEGQIKCPVCEEVLSEENQEDTLPNFCPNCGYSIIAAKNLVDKGHKKRRLRKIKRKEEGTLFNLGRYEVKKHLGQGGQGQVLLAFDPHIEKEVVIKRIRPNKVASASRLAQVQEVFDEEADILKHLNHPNVITILDHQSDENGDYFVMPFIDGHPLQKEITECATLSKKKKPLPENFASFKRIAERFLKICKIVAYTHSQDVIHGDIKPENIMVSKGDEFYLIDWGLARNEKKLTSHKEAIKEEIQAGKKLSEDERLEKLNELKQDYAFWKYKDKQGGGTPPFMAPELVLGGSVSRETDIFALGVVLYSMTIFSLPFRRIRGEVKEEALERLQKEAIEDPTHLMKNKGIPPVFAQIIKKALASRPKDRYQSAEEIISLLKAYLKGEPTWICFKKITDQTPPALEAHFPLSEGIALGASIHPNEWHYLKLFSSETVDPVRVTFEFQLEKDSKGVGLILGASSEDPKHAHQTGFCLWLSNEKNAHSYLKKFGGILEAWKKPLFNPKKPLTLQFSRREGAFSAYVNGEILFSSKESIATKGNLVGFISKDHAYQLKAFTLETSPLSREISPLKLGALLLKEGSFRQAAHTFDLIGIGHSMAEEGAEAIFYRGVSEILEARSNQEELPFEKKYALPFKTFESLANTLEPSLGLLGTALIYESAQMEEEELEVLTSSCGKGIFDCPKWIEHLTHRLSYFAGTDRLATLALLKSILKHSPARIWEKKAPWLFYELRKTIRSFPFLLHKSHESKASKALGEGNIGLTLPLSFLLNQKEEVKKVLDLWPHLVEALTPLDTKVPLTALGALLENGSYAVVEERLSLFMEHLHDLLKDPESFVNPERVGMESHVVPFTIEAVYETQLTGAEFKKEEEEEEREEEEEEKAPPEEPLHEKLLRLVRKELSTWEPIFKKIEAIIAVFKEPDEKTTTSALNLFKGKLTPFETYLLSNLSEYLLIGNHLPAALKLAEFFEKRKKAPFAFFFHRIWSLMLSEEFEKAKAIFDQWPLEKLASPTDPVYFSFGAYLAAMETESLALTHFKGGSETLIPPIERLATLSLGGYLGKSAPFWDLATSWEKRKLYYQLTLYYRLTEQDELSKEAKDLYTLYGKKPYEE